MSLVKEGDKNQINSLSMTGSFMLLHSSASAVRLYCPCFVWKSYIPNGIWDPLEVTSSLLREYTIPPPMLIPDRPMATLTQSSQTSGKYSLRRLDYSDHLSSVR